MRTIMVLNSKGGCGKTTIVTNLAGYYAAIGLPVVLKDFDPQGSSIEWLKQRPYSKPVIHGISPFRSKSGSTRSWQMRIPPETKRIIIDTPAGIDLQRHSSIMKNVDKILIPVQQSAIDIRATAMFIQELHKLFRISPTNAVIGIVANRANQNTPSFFALQRIFNNLDFEFITVLNQSENYAQAAESGISVLEHDSPFAEQSKQDWQPLIDWLEEGEDKKEKQQVLRATVSAAGYSNPFSRTSTYA